MKTLRLCLMFLRMMRDMNRQMADPQRMAEVKAQMPMLHADLMTEIKATRHAILAALASEGEDADLRAAADHLGAAVEALEEAFA